MIDIGKFIKSKPGEVIKRTPSGGTWTKLHMFGVEWMYVERAVENENDIHLQALVEVDDKQEKNVHYIALFEGGKNGNGHWSDYFQTMKNVADKLDDCWLIELNNDCLDDLYTMLMGFRIKK